MSDWHIHTPAMTGWACWHWSLDIGNGWLAVVRDGNQFDMTGKYEVLATKLLEDHETYGIEGSYEDLAEAKAMAINLALSQTEPVSSVNGGRAPAL